jgi:hypothetical protein
MAVAVVASQAAMRMVSSFMVVVAERDLLGVVMVVVV